MMTEDADLDQVDPMEDASPSSAGFMKFYGLYWKKEFLYDQKKDEALAGFPDGWTGKGKIAESFDRSIMSVNFWGQKGVYVLYDRDLIPVYTGQAGLIKSSAKSDNGGKCLGERLRAHKHGKYRNGWSFFSWFGFLDALDEKQIKSTIKFFDDRSILMKRHPNWKFVPYKQGQKDSELNLLLDSFEAILIEAFTPRFNSRGGNLKGATYVNQLEGEPFFVKQDNLPA
ncbi:GIY-YIG nuclease family protein [Tropicimonas sp. IMCC34043]|uniref:GIY-YIG nuclease family protein n=1 Tax=Tropicimonas sp. IMCC34043 TaxID=2248760 RepID=UPI000E267EBC|nr:GIY-YIG nuclease family protein [Tropicimonas sp. IMCC34043]